MESSDPRPASTVFDLPPSETETVPPEDADVPQSTLTESADLEEVGAGVEDQVGSPGPRFAPAHEERAKAASQLGLNPRENPGAMPAARFTNLRRTPLFAKLMALTFLANLLVLGAAALWLQRRWAADLAAASGGPTTSARQELEELRKADAASFESELDGLRKRLAETEELTRRQSARVEELSASLAAGAARKKTAPAASPAAPPPASEPAAAQGELALLKERNRLTSHGDEAIATGARAPYEKLLEALDDPRLAHLSHAAHAEILRVQNFYLGGPRIDRFDIPVGTYFPEDSALSDTQLKDAQLAKLLRDKKNPWEVRMKAANLLGAGRSLEVGDALITAVKEDDHLDVVKEAALSFEQMTGFHSRIFDVASMEQWWTRYKATPTPFKSKARAAARGKVQETETETEAEGDKSKSKSKSKGSAAPKQETKSSEKKKKS